MESRSIGCDNLGRRAMDEQRNKTKKCKKCGKEFIHKWHIKYCPECYSKDRKKQVINFFKANGHWKTKLKWRERIVKCEINAPTKEVWNDTFNPAITEDVCTYCGESHSKDRVYYHPFMKRIEGLAIEISDLEDLIDEIKKRVNKTGKEILEEIGLEKGQLIKEELVEGED